MHLTYVCPYISGNYFRTSKILIQEKIQSFEPIRKESFPALDGIEQRLVFNMPYSRFYDISKHGAAIKIYGERLDFEIDIIGDDKKKFEDCTKFISQKRIQNSIKYGKFEKLFDDMGKAIESINKSFENSKNQ